MTLLLFKHFGLQERLLFTNIGREWPDFLQKKEKAWVRLFLSTFGFKSRLSLRHFGCGQRLWNFFYFRSNTFPERFCITRKKFCSNILEAERLLFKYFGFDARLFPNFEDLYAKFCIWSKAFCCTSLNFGQAFCPEARLFWRFWIKLLFWLSGSTLCKQTIVVSILFMVNK